MFSAVVSRFKRWRAERKSALLFEREVVVRFDSIGISSIYPKGQRQAIAWDEADTVAIDTNDTGPWGADVWWTVSGAGIVCTYPGGATGEQEALAEFHRQFPGFSDEQVVRAMGCTSNARFICWERSKAS